MEFLKAAVNGFYSPRRKDEEHRPSFMWLWKQNLEREREGEREEIIGKKTRGRVQKGFCFLPTDLQHMGQVRTKACQDLFCHGVSLSLSLFACSTTVPYS